MSKVTKRLIDVKNTSVVTEWNITVFLLNIFKVFLFNVTPWPSNVARRVSTKIISFLARLFRKVVFVKLRILKSNANLLSNAILCRFIIRVTCIQHSYQLRVLDQFCLRICVQGEKFYKNHPADIADQKSCWTVLS